MSGRPPPPCPPTRLDRLADEVDGVAAGREVVGDSDRDGGAAVIDRDQRDHARADPLLGLVDQAAQALGVHAFEHLADEAVAADLLRPRRLGLRAAAQRQRLLRLGELALEPAALVEQGGDAGGHLLAARP